MRRIRRTRCWPRRPERPLLSPRSGSTRFHHSEEAQALSDRTTVIEGIGLGILFALLMQVRPFRWAVYALTAWGAWTWFQDWMSEHRLPDDTPALGWVIEEAELQPIFSEHTLTYHVGVRVENRGGEAIQSATLVGTLFECPAPDDPLDRCTPVERHRDHLSLDLPPGFVHHLRVYPSFSGAGGPNPRVTWAIREIVADRDMAVD